MTQGIGHFSGRLKKQRQSAMHQNWRRKKFKDQEGLCAYCSVAMVLDNISKFNAFKACTLDHKIPLGRGGLDHWENVAAACTKCNSEKGDLTDTEFMSGYSVRRFQKTPSSQFR